MNRSEKRKIEWTLDLPVKIHWTRRGRWGRGPIGITGLTYKGIQLIHALRREQKSAISRAISRVEDRRENEVPSTVIEEEMSLDVMLDVMLHPGEKQTRHYPGSPPETEMYEVRVGDVSIIGELSDEQLKELEDDVLLEISELERV